MPITLHDVLTRRATEPGTPAEPAWRSVTFEGARPQEKVWASKAMRKMIHCYDPESFASVDAAWIEEMWLKLLLLSGVNP